MIRSMFYLNPEGTKILGTFEIIKVLSLIGLVFVTHWFMRNTSVRAVSKKMSPVVLGLWWSVMFLLIVVAQGSGEQFIYFQF
jgi:alginate O-acetyltransferase complex protein AlgI